VSSLRGGPNVAGGNKLRSLRARMTPTPGSTDDAVLDLPLIQGRSYEIRAIQVFNDPNNVGDGGEGVVVFSHDLDQTGSGVAIAADLPVWLVWPIPVLTAGGVSLFWNLPEGFLVAGPQLLRTSNSGVNTIDVLVRVWYRLGPPLRATPWMELQQHTSFFGLSR